MGTRYTIGDTPLVIGRASDCDIRINDHSVSRRHARIQPGADGYYAVDLQSTNGTYVNDVPASMYKLKDGDYLPSAIASIASSWAATSRTSITKKSIA